MQFFTGLFTLLKAVPAMVSLITEIVAWMKSTFGDNPERFLLDSAEAFKQAREAKSPKDRTDAAQKIAALIKRL